MARRNSENATWLIKQATSQPLFLLMAVAANDGGVTNAYDVYAAMNANDVMASALLMTGGGAILTHVCVCRQHSMANPMALFSNILSVNQLALDLRRNLTLLIFVIWFSVMYVTSVANVVCP